MSVQRGGALSQLAAAALAPGHLSSDPSFLHGIENTQVRICHDDKQPAKGLREPVTEDARAEANYELAWALLAVRGPFGPWDSLPGFPGLLCSHVYHFHTQKHPHHGVNRLSDELTLAEHL